jgi:hypothetical protein
MALVSPDPGRLIAVNAGTPVYFNLTNAISSGDAQEDQTFTFAVIKDVVTNGMVIIPKGAPGQGHVVSVQKAKWMGRSGSVIVSYDWVTSADGKRLHLQNTTGAVGDGNGDTALGVSIASSVATTAAIQTGAAAAGTALGAVVPYAGYASMFVKGKDVTIGTTVPLQAFVAQGAHVLATQHAVTDSQYDQ